MALAFILILLVTVAVAALGGWFTASSVTTWYPRLRKPRWTPSGRVIGTVWTVLYVLAAASAMLVWQDPSVGVWPRALFGLNALVNVWWSYVFFFRRKIAAAVWVCLLLDLTIVGLIHMLARPLPLAAWLLVPYAAWVTFAAYLNYRVRTMNRG